MVTPDFGRWPEAQSDLWLGRGLPTRHHQRGFSASSRITIPFSLANAEVRLRNPRQVLGEFDANQGDRCMEHGTTAPVRLAEGACSRFGHGGLPVLVPGGCSLAR